MLTYNELEIKGMSTKDIEMFIATHWDKMQDVCKHTCCKYQKLTQTFITQHWNGMDDSCKHACCRYQKLTKTFIKQHWNEMNDACKHACCIEQKLSGAFIAKHWDEMNYDIKYACYKYQKLSGTFITKHWNELNDNCKHACFEYQKLSETFIEQHWNEMNNYCKHACCKYQKLSETFITKNNLKIDNDNWLYWTTERKMQYIKENTKYEITDNSYLIAYKSVRNNYYSVYNFQYQYEIGKTYESRCDCTDNENSFGLSAWTKENAFKYYSKGKLLQVKINIKDIGYIVQSNSKIRCTKLTVVGEVNE